MSKITAEKRPTGKKPPSIPVSMSDSEGLKYVEERCQVLFKNSTYDNEEVQEALKNIGQVYFNYKPLRPQVCDLLIKIKMPGKCTHIYYARWNISVFPTKLLKSPLSQIGLP